MPRSTKDIVFDFFGTFGTDRVWKVLLADDIAFSSPMDSTKGKEAFIPLDTQFRQLVKAASVNWVISEGSEASALVSYDMALPTGDVLNIEFSEIIEVRDRRIASIKVFFDTAVFKEFLSKLSQR